jgi:D-glycerate 3-kinase
MSQVVREILEGWIGGKPPAKDELQQLAAWEMADRERSRALAISAEHLTEIIEARANLFNSVAEEILALPLKSIDLLGTLWKFWLPLAMQLATERQNLGRTLIQGILGGQGTGKTTLAAVLKLIFRKLGYNTISFSLDDLYKTYSERQQLREADPRLIWRGPPGTHDLELGVKVLGELQQIGKSKLIEMPRFDKSAWGGAGDRTKSEIVTDIDLVLFEGWFVGVRPINHDFFNLNLPPIFTVADQQFADDMNKKLSDYLPLWEKLDRLIVLYPNDYRLSQAWRCQAEREMIAAGKSGMSNEEINRFVEYFWKALHPELFIKPLVNNCQWVNLVVEIKSDHSVGRIYQPQSN